MTCPMCGSAPNNATGLCHHHPPTQEDWATANRVMCDFVHRRVMPPSVILDDFVDHSLVA